MLTKSPNFDTWIVVVAELRLLYLLLNFGILFCFNILFFYRCRLNNSDNIIVNFEEYNVYNGIEHSEVYDMARGRFWFGVYVYRDPGPNVDKGQC